MEDIGSDHKMVIYFRGKEKGLVLNKTNANNIAQMFGDETDNWIDQSIVLFSAWVDFQGKTVEAVRVRGVQGQARPAAQRAQAAQAPASPPPAKANGNGKDDLDDTIPF